MDVFNSETVMKTMTKGMPITFSFASGGVTWLDSSSVFQINFSAGLTVLCSEIRHNTKRQNVISMPAYLVFKTRINMPFSLPGKGFFLFAHIPFTGA